MSYIDILKIKPATALVIISSIACNLIGFIYIFHFQQDLFLSLDIFKLILLCIGFTFPINMINVFCQVLVYWPHDKTTGIVKTEDWNSIIFYGNIRTIVDLATGILIPLFVFPKLVLSYSYSMGVVYLIEGVHLILTLLFFGFKRYRVRRKEKSNTLRNKS